MATLHMIQAQLPRLVCPTAPPTPAKFTHKKKRTKSSPYPNRPLSRLYVQAVRGVQLQNTYLPVMRTRSPEEACLKHASASSPYQYAYCAP